MYVRLLAVYLILVTVVSAAPNSVKWFDIIPPRSRLNVKIATDLTPYRHTWEEYKRLYGREYTDVEEVKRYKIFEEKLMMIEIHNKKYVQNLTSYYMGVNQFSDMTHEEYLSYNGLIKIDLGIKSQCKPMKAFSFMDLLTDVFLPTEVDWRKKGLVTKIKDQGKCGSCWAFSTTGTIEGQYAKTGGKLLSLSEQQLVDCSTENKGCNGGLMDRALMYVKSDGIETEVDYPYKGMDGQCKYDKSKVAVNIGGCVAVTARDEDALKEAVAMQGPISVAIDANHPSFQSYQGGIYDEENCSTTLLDHGVLVVGYGTESGQDYWIVKNSWGTMWGDEGYIKMSRNKDNQCGIASEANYPTM